MLKKIKYKGFEIASSQFIEHQDIAGGRYNVSVNECEFSSGYDEDESKSWAQLNIYPSVQGFEEGANEQNGEDGEPDSAGLAFEVKLKLYIFFEIEGKEIISEEFFDENAWFFENFMALSLKLAIESILSHTPLNTIKLPWSMPEDASLGAKKG